MSVNSSKKSLPNGFFRPIVWSVAAIGWVFFVYIFSLFAAKALFTLAAFTGINLTSLSDSSAAFVANTVVWAIMLPTLIIPPLKTGAVRHLRQEIGLQRLPGWTDIGLALAGFIPYIILSMLLNGLALSVFNSYDASQAQDVGFSVVSQRYELLLAFVALVVLAPLIEETIFRGFLYGRLKKHIGFIGSVLLTSLVFAVLHMQINVGLDVFALSLVLCVLREVSGSIWAGVLLHMIKNGLAYYVLFVLPMLQ